MLLFDNLLILRNCNRCLILFNHIRGILNLNDIAVVVSGEASTAYTASGAPTCSLTKRAKFLALCFLSSKLLKLSLQFPLAVLDAKLH